MTEELCQRVLDGKGMPEKWQSSKLVPISEGKEDVKNRIVYRGVKLLLKHAMKMAEKALKEGFES